MNKKSAVKNVIFFLFLIIFLIHCSAELNDIIEGIDDLISVSINKLGILENPKTMANRLKRLDDQNIR